MNRVSKKSYAPLKLNDIQFINRCLPEKQSNEAKRQLRKKLLAAYDTHKTNVLYEGREETFEEKEKMLRWKQNILDLQTDAFLEENIPAPIKYYL